MARYVTMSFRIIYCYLLFIVTFLLNKAKSYHYKHTYNIRVYIYICLNYYKLIVDIISILIISFIFFSI